jgi:hypothetical protein
MYAPIIESARRVREHALGASHTAVLLTDIVGPSRITYAHILVVFASGREDPIAFISSEAKGDSSDILKELGLDDDEFAFKEEEDEGSHFLCAFTENGHSNFGASDDWADLERFERGALDLVARLKLTTSVTGSQAG